mmetsp:Transcript_1257/g.2619  ORF Transcript_1257/g.2619 Transcript_1257/m.2619 type:complete len:289 (-) Transcript_1257:140-1006(-)|eukprot:CAMPEP_0197647500 /NCGR_PEP_ID=MMETSP1338-20131121/25571_1 /TAXON_ID=43686 ORGANISM="Pelagodinium beii, Strain RCC1491" /NCGR_SAMPLE_ID=MMETSP1338 /ASSEMBLY_ACC=CAM_ASM_000754 /LENGTH=288 /DNA_ID=CAMNT_0043221315 /DNA_START=62 /DNA_END=928 /DNA_ORIENTATION=-
MSAREFEMQGVPPQKLGQSGGDDTGLRRRRDDQDSTSSEATCETTGLRRVLQQAPALEERKLNLVLTIVSIIDVISSLVVMSVAFTYAYRAAGVSLYCMGIQAISHLLSSVLLTMRFIGELSLSSDCEESFLRESRRKFLYREQACSVTMGIALLVSAASMLFKAFRKMKFWEKWYLDHQHMDEEAQWCTEFLAWYGFAFYLIQALIRFYMGRKLKRSLIWHAFWASVVSVLYLLVMGIAASYEKEWSWKAEPIAACVLACVNLVEGIRVVISYLDDMDTRMRFDSRA